AGERPRPLGRRELPAREHAERTRRHAVAAAVADVLLHDDGSELGAEERPRRADVEARGVRAVLADVRAHHPAQGIAVELLSLAVVSERRAFLDERDVPPRLRPELLRVVIRLAGP